MKKKLFVLAMIFVLLVCFLVSFFIYCGNKRNEYLDFDLKIQNRYITYSQINDLYLKYNNSLKDVIKKIDTLNYNYSSPCFNMPLKTIDKEDIQIYNSYNNLDFKMDDDLADKLIVLNQLTGINYIECSYNGSPTDGYQKFYFVQTNYKKEDLNYLVYVKTKEKITEIRSDRIYNLLFNHYYPFSYNKLIAFDGEGYWYFSGSRDATKYGFYNRLFDFVSGNT